MTLPTNSTDWYAHVKYKDDGETEVVRVCKISHVRRARDGKILGFEPWIPKTFDDIDKTGYNYHVLTSLKTRSQQEERFFAVCGRLAENKESLEQLENSQGKDRIRYPANLPKYSDSATEASETEDEVTAETLLESQRNLKRQREALKVKASSSMFNTFLKNKSSILIEDAEFLPKRSKTIEAADTDDDTLLSTSQSSGSDVDSMQQKITQLQTEILELERKRDALSGLDLKTLIRDAVKDFMKPELDSVKTVVTTHIMETRAQITDTQTKITDTQTKISVLDSKIDEFSEILSKSPRKAKIEHVQRWVDSIV